MTDALAQSFYSACAQTSIAPARPGAFISLSGFVQEALDRLRSFGDAQVIVKVPEGFEFYSLYPEQYISAARHFLHAGAAPDRGEQRALVLGIRSIGTTLSAVVKVALENSGWHVKRMTVRPHGHPYERKVELQISRGESFDWALIVDEGPGISGSSMAAVAQSLQQAGLPREAIVFLPGHTRGKF